MNYTQRVIVKNFNVISIRKKYKIVFLFILSPALSKPVCRQAEERE
jgi:hypothetical protein